MTLLLDYSYTKTAPGKDFAKKIAAALYKEATTRLLDLVGTEPTYKMEMLFASVCLKAGYKAVVFVANAMVAEGLTNDSSDSTINTAISSNYDKLARLYDPELEVAAA